MLAIILKLRRCNDEIGNGESGDFHGEQSRWMKRYKRATYSFPFDIL